MATFKICVWEHHRRNDVKYRVHIRITHQRKHAYIATDTYVTRKQIASDFKSIKHTHISERKTREIARLFNIHFKTKKPQRSTEFLLGDFGVKNLLIIVFQFVK